MSIVPTAELDPSVPLRSGALSAWLKRQMLRRLAGLQGCALTINDGEERHRCGVAELSPGDLRATITVHHPDFWTAVGLGGSVGAGDAYIRKLWDADNLSAVIRMLARNQQVLQGMDGGLVGLLAGPVRGALHWFNRNTVDGASRNIAAHYDIGNDLFRLMLDPTMMYSSAVFPSAGATLEQAQVHKLDLICNALELRPGEHLVEIGTGWGGLAIHAASRFGVRVTTTTISRQQYDLACERVQAAGLSDRVSVVMQDYRTLEGSYDKLVSIEMVEAVGWQFYPDYMRACARLLKPDGLALIQAITIADQAYERAKHEVDFIKKFIFPGSCIPSLTALTGAATRHSDLRLAAYDDYTPHYARTLALWRDNCRMHADAIGKLGYNASFQRLWEFYLAYCEGGFAERSISVGHLLFAKPGWRQSGHRMLGYA
jgi:cyclopropane-fatty-acyl-phospholipid synthase